MRESKWIKSVSSAYGIHYILHMNSYNNVIRLSPMSNNKYMMIINNTVNKSEFRKVITSDNDDKAKIKAITEFKKYLRSKVCK